MVLAQKPRQGLWDKPNGSFTSSCKKLLTIRRDNIEMNSRGGLALDVFQQQSPRLPAGPADRSCHIASIISRAS
jgi:hypothetical protein